MDQKARIWNALETLSNIAEAGFPDPFDHGAMGPLGLTKALLKEMRHEELLRLPCFEGTWLDMLARAALGKPVGDVFIVPMMLPPAAMLAAGAPDDAARAILAAGQTACIRPPENELLILSPATADAAVYELGETGLRSIAKDVAELVETEVERALGRSIGARLPRYGFDGEPWAVIVAGRRFESPATQGHVRRVEAFVRGWGQEHALPLAYVHMGTTINWSAANDDAERYERAPAIIGRVVAQARQGIECPVERSVLDVASVPAAFWDALQREHAMSSTDEGVYLAPSGWSGAQLRASQDDDALVHSWAEDTSPGARLDLGALPPRFTLSAQHA